MSLLFALGVLLIGDSSARAQRRQIAVPRILATDAKGRSVAVKDEDLCNFELELREQFRRSDAPDEVFAVACGGPGDTRLPEFGISVGRTTISVYGKQGELRSYFDNAPERYYYRNVSGDEIDAIRKFVANNKVDELPELRSEKVLPNGNITAIVGGAQYLYVHLDARGGRRVSMNNPPSDEADAPPDDPAWQYKSVVDFFGKFDDDLAKLEVRYAFPRPNKGLHVLYAPRLSEVLAVWKPNGQLCVTARKKWERDARDEHRVLRVGKLEEEVADPKRGVRSRIEVAGSTLLPACESSDGRYVVGNRDDNGDLVCYDREEKKFIEILDKDLRTKCYPLRYLDAHSAFLLDRLDKHWILKKRGGFDSPDSSDFRVLDPATGTAQGLMTLPGVETSFVDGVSLWFQDLPRRLQPVRGKPYVVWTAAPRDNGTEVCQFDTKTLQYADRDYVPNFKFETKHLWVDEGERKIYFVYKGHLNSVPLRTAD